MIAPDPAPAGPRPAAPARTEAAGDPPARYAKGRDFGTVLSEPLRRDTAREPAPPDAAAAPTLPAPPPALPDTALPAGTPAVPGPDAPTADAVVADAVVPHPLPATPALPTGDAAVADAAIPLPPAATSAMPAVRQATPVPAETGPGSGAGQPAVVGDRFAAPNVAKAATRQEPDRPAATEPVPPVRVSEPPPQTVSLAVQVPPVAPVGPAVSGRPEADAAPGEPVVTMVVRGSARSLDSHQPPSASAAVVTAREVAAAEPSVVLRDAAAPTWHLAPEPAATHARIEPTASQASQPQAVIGQVAVAISKASDRKIEIRLDPPELGRVQIHLNPTDGGVQAVVMAQRPETQDLLRRHAEMLAQELNGAGYGNVSLDFAGGGEAPSRRGDAPANDRHYAAGAPAPVEVAAVARPQPQLAGGLDIRL